MLMSRAAIREEVGMRVVVRVFARLKEEFGKDRLILELPDEATLEELLMRVLGRPRRGHVMVAVNNRLLPGEGLAGVRLRDGDVVDLMPPASGG